MMRTGSVRRRSMIKGKVWIRIMSGTLVTICMTSLLAGCTGDQKKTKSTKAEEVQIPMILTVDPSTGKKNEENVVEAFNEKYKGKYQVLIDWSLETEDEYRQNLKKLNVTDKLPAVLTDISMLPSFYQMMIKEERIMDLSSYIKNDSEWMAMIEPEVLKGCTSQSGAIYLSPLSTAAFSCSGIFWNEELFQKAGISDFPETWEEFWQCCMRLKAAGITQLALHTDGTAWAPMLFATAELGSMSEEGAEFMEQVYPNSYYNEQGKELAATLKKLFAYTTEDALHTDFDVAYNNFFSGKAAMIPNGYWMMDQIPEGWEEKVRFAAFPENTLISSPETFGWAIADGYDQKIKEGAVEFLKFRTAFNLQEKEAFFSQSLEQITPAERDYMEAYQKEMRFVPNYQVKWNSVFQEETLEQYLPELVTNKITEEEFLEAADESIRQFRMEQ